jgi:hypothetical protein
MTRSHAQAYMPAEDPYAAFRCVNCPHLRYAGQAPDSPCWYCDCTEHVLPSEVPDAAP